MLNKRFEMPLGQDEFSFAGNIKENNVNEYKSIETVRVDKSDDFFTATDISKSSCPTVRFFDSGTIGHDDFETSCPILSYSPKTQSSIKKKRVTVKKT